MTLVELQSHSTHSDGQLAPADVVAEAAKAGVTTLALSDHDSVAGVPDALVAGKELGVEIVPAVEMSAVHEYAEDLHICGYWIDLEKIEPTCERAQEERRNRAGEIVENLRGFGFELTLEDAIREAGGADSIGRPTSPRPPAPPVTSGRSSRSTWFRARKPSCRAAGRAPRRRSG